MTDAPPPRSARTYDPSAARRAALDVLFEADLRREPPQEALERSVGDLDTFARDLVRGVGEELADLDAVIEAHSTRWRVSRMPAVDRNVLRLAVHELRRYDTPPAVVIDEAVELAKLLSTDDSPRFVNGLLEAIRRDLG